MNRAKRRFYVERSKIRIRRRMINWRWEATDRHIGIAAKTRKRCSSYCCGSKRLYEGISFQEKKYFDSYKSQLDEL